MDIAAISQEFESRFTVVDLYRRNGKQWHMRYVPDNDGLVELIEAWFESKLKEQETDHREEIRVAKKAAFEAGKLYGYFEDQVSSGAKLTEDDQIEYDELKAKYLEEELD